MSLPISVFRTNSTPISVKISRRSLITSFSSLNDGIPKVSRPPISSYLSNTTGLTPLRTRISAHARPAGPAPTIATFLSVQVTPDISGRQPILKAVSVMYFSIDPMVTAPNSSFRVHDPSHRRSCGQTRPQTSGKLLVLCDNSAASMILPSLASASHCGM